MFFTFSLIFIYFAWFESICTLLRFSAEICSAETTFEVF